VTCTVSRKNNYFIILFPYPIKINREINFKKGIADTYNNIGTVYMYQGDYEDATDYYLKSLKIDEEIRDKKGIAMANTNLGIIHSYQKNFDNSIKYFLKSLEINKEIGNKNGIASSYNNVGIGYNSLGEFNKANPSIRDSLYNIAIEYYFKALEINKETEHRSWISNNYSNIGVVYQDMGNNNLALESFLKSLKIEKEIGDKNGIASSYGSIASLNLILADSSYLNPQQKQNYLNEAIKYGTKALELARKINVLPIENKAANTLMEAYKKLRNYKKSNEYAEIYISTNDSMFNNEKTNALTELEVRYKAEKNKLQIEKMEKQELLDKKTIEAQQAQNRKQLVIIFSAITGFIVVLVFMLIILRMFSLKRRANIKLAQQNEEINQQKEEITAQRDEISAQRDLAAKQRDLISEQKEELTDSIHYAYRIQSAVIPSDDYISELLSDYFILYKPRDIVSGDFYWIGKQNNKIIVLAADCTGHGVPGAFMSMLGVAFLNEIVNKENITSPAKILNRLRENIIKALKQKGQEGEAQDGMDVAAITIDTKTNKLEYSGANNPLYIITDRTLTKDENISGLDGLHEIKANKQPVAIHIKMNPFTNHEIDLQKGDTIYMFSDGYADQFGGPYGKKFKYKPFKRLLLENINKPMNEQKEVLENRFDEWKGDLDQIDDVVIVGIKI